MATEPHSRAEGSVMEEHLVVYIDLLGSKAAVSQWDKERIERLVDLLHGIATLRSDFVPSEETVPHAGSGVTRVKLPVPAVSTFSDHLVVSYPTEALRTWAGERYLGAVSLHPAQWLISQLAAESMKLGLLIRGGATVGPLHHAGGVVVGQAMIEAYELESRVAIYPRIPVSRKLYAQLESAAPGVSRFVFLEDADGIRHLNYFDFMLHAGGGQPGEMFAERLGSWLIDARRAICESIKKFEAEERWNELAKWTWIRNRVEDAVLRCPKELLNSKT